MAGDSKKNGAGGRAGGRLAANVMQFARTLRAAGLPVGPGKVLEALRAVEAVGFASRQDFYWALHSVFVNRRDQRELFDQAFHLFWRNPRILDRIMDLLLPSVQPTTRPQEDEREAMSRRLAEALGTEGGGESEDEGKEEIEVDAALTWSDRELLQGRDFEQMSAAELAEAKQLVKGLRLPIMALPTRRFRPDDRGARADLRAMFRAALRSGSDSIPLKRRAPQRRHPPLVVLCDISGSMSRYSRMFLHFLHAITNDRDRVHSFVFGTRLTNVTRYLRQKDVDIALQSVSQVVLDWSGGTRIGACLADFNRHWSRRVLGQGAVVLLITDGLDRDNAGSFLEREVERLHKSCRRLIWLNPLLRYEGYEPKSQGARALIRHVDDLRSIHNLESLRHLAEVLSHPSARRAEAATRWQEVAA
ncbi:MAG: vWA domain-containing protein [Kiloniellales bacterium]